MASVFLAEFRGPAGFRKRAALKVIREASLADDEVRRAALLNEARVGGLLKHPNIVDVYDFGLVGGQPFVAMELVEGIDLARLVRGRGPLPPAVACAVGASICAGLHHAHCLSDGAAPLRLVHRDLKPSNVLIGPSGEVKVVDFGLAKATAFTGDTTATGVTKGTPPYMSPEQLRCEPFDRRSDLFAFGALLFELLTAERFFDQPTAPSVIMAINEVERHIAPPSRLAPLDALVPGMTRLVRRCLRFDPTDRFQDAAEVRAELLRLSAAAPLPEQAQPDDWLAGAVAEIAPSSAFDVPSPPSHESEVASDSPVLLSPHRVVGHRAVEPALPSAPRRSSRLPALVAVAALLLGAGWLISGLLRSTTGPPGLPAISVGTVLNTPSGRHEGQPALSPGGDRLLFVEGGDSLWELDLASGARHPLLRGSGPLKHPAFSPDGVRLAVALAGEREGIFVADLAALRQDGASALRRVTDFGVHPSWSPDGLRLAFSTVDYEQTAEVSYAVEPSELWVVELQQRVPRRLDVYAGNMPAWSPSGERLAFWAIDEAGRRNVLTMPSAGGEVTAVTDGDDLDWNPRWSPDGTRLWFLSDRSGAGSVWRVPIDEATGETLGPATPVTTGSPASPGFLSLDGEGRRVAFHELTRRWNVQVVPLDPSTGRPTGEPRWLTRGDRRIQFAHPSPDGRLIALWDQVAREDVVVLEVATGQERRLTDDEALDRGAVFSPDGEQIAFYSNRGGTWAVWTMRLDGSGRVKVIEQAGWTPPRWSPDGRRLSVYDLETDRFNLVTLDERGAGADREVVLAQAGPDTWLNQFGWSPDGASLLIGIEDRETWQAEHFLYDIDRGELTAVETGADHVRWLAPGRLIGATDEGVGVADWPGGEPEVILELEGEEELLVLEVSADGSLLVLVRGDQTTGMRVLEVEEG